jgi:hypothetical protein
MNLAAIHLCEHATVDRDARLSMLNAFNTLKADAPAQLPRACVAMVFTFGPDQRGKSHEVRVEFLTGNREEFLPTARFPFTLASDPAPAGMPYRFIQTLNINGMVLKQHGVHTVEVYVDDIFLGSEQFLFQPKEP